MECVENLRSGERYIASATDDAPARRLFSRRNFLFSRALPALMALSPAAAVGQAAGVKPPLGFMPASLDGIFPNHLQGICTNNRDSIYWSMTTDLVKTDTTGAIVKRVPVVSHHGDLCYLDGKLYVAVNLGAFNRVHEPADSWIYVYDADDLSFLSKHKAGEVTYGAGGMTFGEGKFLVVGGLPAGFHENYLYEYDRNLDFIRKIVLKSEFTFGGIQTAAYNAGHWWFGCYGWPEMTLRVDREFRTIQKFTYDCSCGIVPVDEKTFLVARNACSKSEGCTATIVPAALDDWIAKGVMRPLDDRITGTIDPWRTDLLSQLPNAGAR